jgi:hypothetical protein
MGVRARERFENNFTSEIIGEQYARVYADVIESEKNQEKGMAEE